MNKDLETLCRDYKIPVDIERIRRLQMYLDMLQESMTKLDRIREVFNEQKR